VPYPDAVRQRQNADRSTAASIDLVDAIREFTHSPDPHSK